MPSFDVTSKVNQQELTNAISNCNREISTRFDFKGLHILIEANQKDNTITVVAPDDLKLKQVNDLLKGHLVKRKIDPMGRIRSHCGSRLRLVLFRILCG